MADKRVRVVVCGEVLCDLFSPRAGIPIAEATHLVPRLGGAPANVAVQLARLGVQTALVTGVGADPFGERARRALADEGVDLRAVRTMPGRRTGATLVEVDADGERRFFGFREASADLALTVADVDRPDVHRLLRHAVVVHSGTVSLRTDNARDATRFLQAAGRQRGAMVSVDVNLRPGMYPDRALMLERARGAVAASDILKATREEAALVLGRRPTSRLARLAEGLLALGPRLVMLTDGEAPMLVATARHAVERPALSVRVVDATGAGDAFCGAALAALIGAGVPGDHLDDIDEALLERIIEAGRVAGAAAVTRPGATTAMVRRLPGRRGRGPARLVERRRSSSLVRSAR
jgi:fructokinase